jgi:hypothetical protein
MGVGELVGRAEILEIAVNDALVLDLHGIF